MRIATKVLRQHERPLTLTIHLLMVDPRRKPGRGRSLEPTRCVSGARLCHGRTARLTLAAEPFGPCEDLAEAWSVPSQLSSVVLTVLMPCIIGISDGAVRFSSDFMMAVARRGADRSCGPIAVTRPRSLKMRART